MRNTDRGLRISVDGVDAQAGEVRAVNVHEKGGHFGASENPEAWIADLRATVPRTALSPILGSAARAVENVHILG